MNNYLLIFAFISLVLCQTGTVTNECPYPCWAANTNPCPSNDLVCKENPNSATIGSNTCTRTCIKIGATSAEVDQAFKDCTTPCDTQTFKCTSDQVCKQKPSGCSNCEPACNYSQCIQRPCDADTRAKECAMKVGGSAAVCRDNYCGGCQAEWFFNGVRICSEVANACPTCTSACPNGAKPKVDPNTGCDKCGECDNVCPVPSCASPCPNGYQLQSNGCPGCTCNPCPDLAASCTLACTEYVVDPFTGCKKCACVNNNVCNTTNSATCNIMCTNGFQVDEKGCKLCKCRECPTIDCQGKVCPAGSFLDKVTGCPTCDCLPTCQNICPLGYDFNSANTGSLACKCNCPTLNCLIACENGAEVDAYGCPTCKCLPKYDGCAKVACNLWCEFGYVTDDKNCPTCECIKKPTVCPMLACTSNNCLYGTATDEFKCPTCDCNPCPPVFCAKPCLYGYKKGDNGCQTCTCNDAPVCPTTNVASTCPLNCEKGLVDSNGCTYCKCNPVEPCKCGPQPTDPPRLCPDGKTYQKFTDICFRDEASNTCKYIMTKCPYVISVTLTKDLSEADIEKIKSAIGITDSSDITVEKTSDGTSITYKLTINQDGIPEGKTANDVNNDVGTKAKEADSNAASFVLSDGTPLTSFANILAPFFGLLSIFLFF